MLIIMMNSAAQDYRQTSYSTMIHEEAPSHSAEAAAAAGGVEEIEIYTHPSTNLTRNDLRRMLPISMQITELWGEGCGILPCIMEGER